MEPKIIKISNLSKSQISSLSDKIYHHFIHLSKFPKLNHTINNIKQLLSNPKFFGLFILLNNEIIGYIVGSDIVLNDKRTVYYVDYIYISENNRYKKLGSKLMDIVEFRVKKLGYNGVLLICDTEDFLVYNFYLKRGYFHDTILRRYEKHDVLYKGFTKEY